MMGVRVLKGKLASILGRTFIIINVDVFKCLNQRFNFRNFFVVFDDYIS